VSINIRIDDNFLDVAEAFKELGPKELVAAGRRALNRTIVTVRKTAMDEIRQKRRIKPSTLREKHIWLEKAGGGMFNALSASVVFSSKPIPMLEFVRGRKSPTPQKGIKVARRKKVRVEIVPGRRQILKNAFIQHVRSLQVFKRPKGQDNFKYQGTRSIGSLAMSGDIKPIILDVAETTLKANLLAEMQYQSLKLQGKVKPTKW
jgi:hypothetical protein